MTKTQDREEKREGEIIQYLNGLGAKDVKFDGYRQSYRFSIGGALVEIIDQRHRAVATIWRKPKDRTEELLFVVWRSADWRSISEEIRSEVKTLFEEQELFLDGNYLTTFKKVVDAARLKEAKG